MILGVGGSKTQPIVVDQNTILPDEINVRLRDKKLWKYNGRTSENKAWAYAKEDRLEVRESKRDRQHYEVVNEIDYMVIKNTTEQSITKSNSSVYLLFIIEKYDPKSGEQDADHLLMTLVFLNESARRVANELIKTRIRDNAQEMKNLMEFNYLGIEENMRKAIEYAIVDNRGKREIYIKIMPILAERIRQRKIPFSPAQRQLMLKALVSDHRKVRQVTLQQKIEAYDIEKNRYGYELQMAEQQGNMMQLDGNQIQLEGYSEKRNMDGVVAIKREQMKQNRKLTQLQTKFKEEVYLDRIPDRQGYEIDELLAADCCDDKPLQTRFEFEWYNRDHENNSEMEIQREKQAETKKGIAQGPVKIPVKQYDIFSKREILFSHNERPKPPSAPELDSRVSIEAVKFMYRLIKVNDENRKQKRQEGPLAFVLEILKDFITLHEKKLPENSSMSQMLRKANANYMRYKKQMHK